MVIDAFSRCVVAKRFIAQWTTTGGLNGQVEETFTGHAVLKVFGRQREAEDARSGSTMSCSRPLPRQFIAGLISRG